MTDQLLLEAMTPREALLIIIGIGVELKSAEWEEAQQEIERVAREGLHTPLAAANYELSDNLADRLAEAHKLLRELREGTEMAVVSGEIDQALALSPDIEAMVERRIGHR